MISNKQKSKLRQLLVKVSPEDKPDVLADDLLDKIKYVNSKIQEPADYSSEIQSLRSEFKSLFDSLPDLKPELESKLAELEPKIPTISEGYDDTALRQELSDLEDLLEINKQEVLKRLNNLGGGSMYTNPQNNWGNPSTYNLNYNDTTKALNNSETLGAELAPALTTGNWTLGTGWSFSNGTLVKGVNGFGTAVPVGLTTVANTRYRVTFTISSLTVGSINQIKMGSYVMVGSAGVNGDYCPRNAPLSAAGTYTYEFTTAQTGALTITSDNLSRFVISAISIKIVTPSTGQATLEGDVYTKGSLHMEGTLISPKISYFTTVQMDNLSLGGMKPRFLEIIQGGNNTLSGLALSQTDGQELYIINFSPATFLTIPHQSASSTDVNRFQTSTSADLSIEYGAVAYCRYNGGTINRWFATKFGTGAFQFNGLTAGLSFGDYLSTLIANSDEMLIGSNSANISLSYSTATSQIGDTQGSNQGQRIKIDANNKIIDIDARGGGLAKMGDTNENGNSTKITIDDSIKEINIDNRGSGITKLGDVNGSGTGTKITIDDSTGLIKLSTLPTSDPAVAGALYQVSGVLMISL